ncbi:MAG: hypothetical protein J6X80_05350 [Lachnospiraceae bacterium]|nr:hypothetical protein [Lachnospiraceae bacterium]
MEAINVSKKFRDVCCEIIDGSYESIDKLEAFPEYPHQVMAVKAAVAFFDKEYDKAIELVEGIMPYWDEWYYSNVCNEYMAATVFAAKEIGREEKAREIIKAEQERLLSADREKCENGRHQRYNYCKLMLNYLDTGLMPRSKEEMEYVVPADAKSKEELISSMKLKTATAKDKIKLYGVLCMKGLPEDAVRVYEEIKDEILSEMNHENAIIRYLYLGEEEKALETIELLATARLWSVASPTQVRPMNFFTHPMMHKYLRDESSLERIRNAAFIDKSKK